MVLIPVTEARRSELVQLFTQTFTDSDGKKEGEVLRSIVLKLAQNMDDQEIICLGAEEDSALVGAIFFSPLKYQKGDVSVYLLSPVAVATTKQRLGIGKRLIEFGLNELRSRQVEVVMTYGDPTFYSKIGFQKVSESQLSAPYPLSIPDGWLGQSLCDTKMPYLTDRPSCCDAFQRAEVW